MALNWTIGRKLAGLSCLGAVLILIIAAAGVRSVAQLREAIAEVHESGQAVRTHMRADMMHDALRSDVLGALLAAESGDAGAREGVQADIADHAGVFRDALAENDTRITDPAIKAKLAELRPLLNTYIGLAEQLCTLAFKDRAAARARLPEFIKGFEELEPALESVSESIEEYADRVQARSNATVSDARLSMFGVGAIALLALGFIGTRISSSIVGPLRRSVEITSRIADGDLDHDIHVSGADETAQLLDALRRMSTTVAGVVAQVRAAAESVTHSSREVASGTMDLSQRIEQQAASLEETSSSTNQIASTVANNAATAGEAGRIADGAARSAADSREVVERSAQAMDEISTSSRRIAEIIGTIDGIAFQTNLLALNAAVEAARAGEHGRGFAVVASEVRNLSQRCAEAAREIKALIAESVDRVRVGTELVRESSSALSGTEQAVGQLSGLVREVAGASHEQASGVEQINRAVTHMDGMTQQNAALVEELAAASSSMEQQAQDLLRAVSYFKTGDAAPGMAAAAPAASIAPRAPSPRIPAGRPVRMLPGH